MEPKWNPTSTNVRKIQITTWKPCTKTLVSGFSNRIKTELKSQYHPNINSKWVLTCAGQTIPPRHKLSGTTLPNFFSFFLPPPIENLPGNNKNNYIQVWEGVIINLIKTGNAFGERIISKPSILSSTMTYLGKKFLLGPQDLACQSSQKLGTFALTCMQPSYNELCQGKETQNKHSKLFFHNILSLEVFSRELLVT